MFGLKIHMLLLSKQCKLSKLCVERPEKVKLFEKGFSLFVHIYVAFHVCVINKVRSLHIIIARVQNNHLKCKLVCQITTHVLNVRC